MMLLLLPSLVAAALADEPPPPGAPTSGAPTSGAPPAGAELPPLVKEPQLLHFEDAPYPEEAKAAGLEAKVLLAIEVGVDGTVTKVDVERPAGHGFDEAAVEAAKKMTFSPAEDANGPVAVVIEFEYGFTLDKASQDGASPPAPDAPPPPPADLPVNLEGTLVEMGTRRPLPDVAVRVEPEGVETRSDAEGKWSFRGLPLGAHTVRVTTPGFDPISEPVDIREGEATTAKLWLRNQGYKDEGIVGSYKAETAEVSRRTITMEEIRRVPGTFGDPIRVVQSMPGAARAPFGTGLLIIRGSNPEDSGVYIDGIRIPYIYHLGGFESVINPDLVAAVDYLPGGFGARYGRSTGGVIDVRTRDEFPERTKVSWNTDLLDTGVMASGSFGSKHQHGFGVAARRSYIDAILPAFMDTGFVVKPRWYDYQAKYILQDGAARKFSVLAFGFQDKLIASTPPGYAQGTDPDGQGDLGTTYSTHRILVDWETPLRDDWKLRIIPAFGNDQANIRLGNSWRVDQSQWLAEIRAEAPWEPSKHFKLTPGLDFLAGWADFTVTIPFDPASFASTDPLAEREPFAFSADQTGWGPDPYLMAEIRPLKDPDALVITPGFRMEVLDFPGEFFALAADPRLAARWAPFPSSHVKGSVGLYHQPPQPYQSYRQDDQKVDLVPEQAFSASVGWEQDVGQAFHGEVEFFWKDLSDLVVDNPNFTSLEDQFFTNEGTGKVYGMEVILRHEPIGRFFGWISYTLSHSERTDHPGDDPYLFDYDQTHILNVVGGYKLPYDFEISGKGEYVTGNPTTPYSLGIYDVDQDSYQGFQSSAYNSERLPPFWEVSLRVDKLFTFRAWQLDLYVDLINLVHGTNPEFELYNYDYTEKTYVKGLPFIPSPGFEAKFEF